MQDLQTWLQISMGLAAMTFIVGLAMSYRTWRWYTMTLLFFVLVAAGTFFWMSVQVLHVHRQWSEYQRELAKELKEVSKKNEELEFGIEKDGKVVKDGIRQLKQKLVANSFIRGRMWNDCQPGTADAATGEVKVTVTEPNPAQVKKGMGLFVFDAKPSSNGGGYLGEFRVTNVVGGGGDMAADEPMGDAAKGGPKTPAVVTLVPAWRLLPRELDRFRNSRGPWTMYDKMPIDDHQVMVDINREPLRGDFLRDATSGKPATRESVLRPILPPSVVPEYAHDLQPATADDSPDRVAVKVRFLKIYEPSAGGTPFKIGTVAWLRRNSVKGSNGTEMPGADDLEKQGVVKILKDEPPRFERELRDYVYLFRTLYLERQRLADLTEDVRRQIADDDTVYVENVALTKTVDEEKIRLEHDKKHFEFELAAILAHYKALERQYFAAYALLTKTFRENQALVEKLADVQRRAAAAIERRNAQRPQASLPAKADVPLPAGL